MDQGCFLLEIPSFKTVTDTIQSRERGMTDLVDGRLYAELAGRNAADVVLSPCCEYHEETQCYTVRAWGGSYVVCPHQAMIRPEAGTAEPPIYFSIFLVNYLLAEKKATPAGQWI